MTTQISDEVLAIVRPSGRHSLSIPVNERFSPFSRIDYLTEDTDATDWAWLNLRKVQIRKITSKRIKFGRTLYQRVTYLKENLRDADFIDTSEVFTFTSRQCCSAASSLHKKLIVTVIETIPRHISAFVPPFSNNSRYVINRADLFVALTERAKAYLQSVGAPSEKIRVIPQGLDLDVFHPGKANFDDKTTTRLLIVSQLHPLRGIVECLEAFRRLCKTRQDIELWVVGDGVLRDVVNAYAARFPIRVFGHIPYQSIPDIFRQATIFCLPGKDASVLGVKTFEDGQFTISVLEAMASGLPVVVTKSGAYSEIVEPHNLFVKQGSVDSLHEALAQLISDKTKMKQIGRLNRDWMIQHFNGESQCKEYAQALAGL